MRDDLSGVFDLEGQWVSLSGSQDVVCEYLGADQIISGNINHGDFRSDGSGLDRTSEPGIWTLKSFTARDSSFNEMEYDMHDLKEIGLPYSFEVVNSRIPTKDDSGDKQDDSSDQQVVNNVTNVVNEITNNTTVNIQSSGSGDVIVGDIGAVNNTTTIDNSYSIQTTNINLSLAITGDSKKGEKVEGTDGDDLIADGRDKDG